MSKKYDEDYERNIAEYKNLYVFKNIIIPMIPPKEDEELLYEIADKLFISYIELALSTKKEINEEEIITAIYTYASELSAKTIDEQIIERGKSIIKLLREAKEKGNKLSYGDIKLIIDKDEKEKEYEISKKRTLHIPNTPKD